jgi:hypothetical protein
MGECGKAMPLKGMYGNGDDDDADDMMIRSY